MIVRGVMWVHVAAKESCLKVVCNFLNFNPNYGFPASPPDTPIQTLIPGTTASSPVPLAPSTACSSCAVSAPSHTQNPTVLLRSVQTYRMER